MKTRIAALLAMFGIFAGFGYVLMRSTNASLERNARSNYGQSFQILAYTLDNYLEDIQQLAAERDQAYVRIADDFYRSGRAELPEEIIAAWRFDSGSRRRLAGAGTEEDRIAAFYAQNLAGRSARALIVVQQDIYQLVNCHRERSDFLFLIEGRGPSAHRLQQILATLIRNSDLRFFSILDREQNPLLYESRFENYLPILGTGDHLIQTPAGLMLQFERPVGDRTLIAGFDMSGTVRAQRANLLFIGIILAVSAVLTGLLIAHLLNFDRYRVRKEREVAGLRELSALSAGFTHEFKNSLQTLALLGRRLDGRERAIVDSEVGRMDAVIKSFTVLSRSDINPVPVDLAAVIDEAAAFTAVTPPGFAVENAAGAGLRVAGDRTLLALVFTNLLRNSIEAGAGHVRIGTELRHGFAVVHYHDDGPGIGPADAARLFEPFYSRKQQTGLGLYLVKKILLLHGGDIETRPGPGVHFRITLKESR